MSHWLLFLKRYFNKPMGIGAIAPSSQGLAHMMVQNLNLQENDVVVEIGPGTGVFTAALLDSGVRPENLFLVEFDQQFVALLRQKYPFVKVLEGDARHLVKLLPVKNVKRVISGLPLRSMPLAVRREIGLAIAAVLQPDGVYVQFSYMKAAPLNDDHAGEA